MSFGYAGAEEKTLIDEPVYVDEALRRKRLLPAAILSAIMGIAFVTMLFLEGGMYRWAVSGPGIAEGKYGPIFLHMFAHGGIGHIVFNTMALLAFGPSVMERLGPLDARSAGAFVVLFLASGFAGLAAWLALNPTSEIPMLGASGAVFGLIGFLLRKPDPFDPPIPLHGRAMVDAFVTLAKLHLPLIIIFAVPLLLGGTYFGLAWEVHVGGFIAGLLLCGPILRWANDGPDWELDEEVE